MTKMEKIRFLALAKRLRKDARKQERLAKSMGSELRLVQMISHQYEAHGMVHAAMRIEFLVKKLEKKR